MKAAWEGWLCSPTSPGAPNTTLCEQRVVEGPTAWEAAT
jgi:hypothetical protein